MKNCDLKKMWATALWWQCYILCGSWREQWSFSHFRLEIILCNCSLKSYLIIILMDCSDWECRHWKVLLSSSRRKSTWHPKHIRSCGEAGDFNDVTLAWKDGLLLTLKSESVDDSKQPVFWKWRTSRRCQRLAANPENGVWWRQICWKMICFRAEAWMCHNHCGRKYSGFWAYAAKLLKLMPCNYTGNSVLGVVWSVATPSGNSFTYLHFIGSFYTVCFMSINCILSCARVSRSIF